LTQVHDLEARKTLAWLIDRSHVEAPLSVLAAAYAAEAAPLNDREVHAVAHANAQRLRSLADATSRRARRYTRECRGAAAITPALADAHAAVAQTEAAARSSEAAALRASQTLAAWGHARITAAIAVWMAA
jgi:UDP-3-O-[3-hydroxymyristoyl] glucosamine N-acyltransferase